MGITGKNDSKEPSKENYVIHILHSCGYSIQGLGTAWKHEAAFRIECVLAFVLLLFVFIIPLPWVMRSVLVFSILAVLVAELLNSGLERVVDYISQEWHPLAKRVKDMGSAAVFLALLNCGAQFVIAVLMWQGMLY